MNLCVVDTAQGYHNEDRELSRSTALYPLPSILHLLSFLFYPPMLPLCSTVPTRSG
jgi:hypothetical protein